MKWLPISGLYVLIFTGMLDTSVANLSLTRIAPDLSLDVMQASFVMTSFGSGLVLSFPSAGLLSGRMNEDGVLLLGTALFLFSSIACATSVDVAPFFVARFVQGFGSGLAIIVSQGMMIRLFGDDKRAFAIALWSSAVSLAPVLGPPLGAYLSDEVDWRLIFLINVPLLAYALLVLRGVVTLERRRVPLGRRLGTMAAFTTFVITLQFVLDFGERLEWFANDTIKGAAAVSLATFALFLAMNQKPDARLFDLSLFADRVFTGGTALLVAGNGIIFASMVILPIWLQTVYGLPLVMAGMIVSISSAIAGIAVPFVGRGLKSGRYLTAIGISVTAMFVSFLIHSRLTIDTAMTEVVMGRIAAGVGLALFTAALLPYSLSRLASPRIGPANSLSMTLRMISVNICVAVGFVFYERIHLTKQVLALAGSHTDGFLASDEAKQLHQILIGRQSYTDALTEMSLIIAFFFLFCLLAVVAISFRQRSFLPKVDHA